MNVEANRSLLDATMCVLHCFIISECYYFIVALQMLKRRKCCVTLMGYISLSYNSYFISYFPFSTFASHHFWQRVITASNIQFQAKMSHPASQVRVSDCQSYSIHAFLVNNANLSTSRWNVSLQHSIVLSSIKSLSAPTN